MKKFFEEFKKFAVKGNAFDMAVGVIIGGAFTSIVNSLVKDIFTPLIGVVTGGIDFSGLIITVGESQILVGNFINAIISFLLVSISVFMLVKFMNILKKKEEEKPAPDPKPSNEEILLTEIRDILKEHK